MDRGCGLLAGAFTWAWRRVLLKNDLLAHQTAPLNQGGRRVRCALRAMGLAPS
jgi:hypothetical protein